MKEQLSNPDQDQQIKISKNLLYKIIIGLLLLIVIVMLLVWQPWNTPTSNDRVISVSGETTLKAIPDEYVFNPVYKFKNSDKAKALAEQTSKNNEIVAQLKKLGVKDSHIKSSSDNYSDYYSYNKEAYQTTYDLRLTVTVADKKMAQRVQDYLLSTSPEGEVTPQAGFSESKRKELENKARDLATKDARSKAEQIAKNTGARLGKVKAIQDGSNFDTPAYTTAYKGETTAAVTEDSRESMNIQPGENELNYTVSVSYYLK